MNKKQGKIGGNFHEASRSFLLVMGVFLLAGCAGAGPEPQSQADAAALAPQAGWKAGGIPGEVSNGWIARFNDPVLVTLVTEGLDKNPDVVLASANLQAAIAEAKQANAALYPNLNLDASGAKTSYLKENSSVQKLTGSDYSRMGSALNVSWEIDVWGKLASQKRGTTFAAQATASDYAFARQSLAAQIAKAYFQAIAAKLQRDLANEFVTNYQKTFTIVQTQWNAGAVSKQDLYSAQAQLASSQQTAQLDETAFHAAVRGVEVLLGRYPANELQVADDLQAVPPLIPAGLPSQILARRPDVISAEREVASAFEFSKSEAAARLPQLSLTSSLGVSSSNLSNLLNPEYAAVAFGLNLFQPLFDAGLREAQLEQAKAEQKAAMARYKKTTLNAFQEVENDLDNDTSLKTQEDRLRQSAENYENARKIAEVRYKEGATDLTTVLDTQRQELQAKMALIEVQALRLTNRVDLHLALGGNFEGGPIDLTPQPLLLNP